MLPKELLLPNAAKNLKKSAGSFVIAAKCCQRLKETPGINFGIAAKINNCCQNYPARFFFFFYCCQNYPAIWFLYHFFLFYCCQKHPARFFFFFYCCQNFPAIRFFEIFRRFIEVITVIFIRYLSNLSNLIFLH